MNLATVIAAFLMTNPTGLTGHIWSYERLQDSAMVCVDNQCIVIPDGIVADPVEPEVGA